jgi:hypothetical protein
MLRRSRPSRQLSLNLAIAVAVLIVHAEPSPAQTGQPLESSPVSTVRISVFSLFRPRELILRPTSNTNLQVEVGNRTRLLIKDAQTIVIHVSDGRISAQLQPQSASESQPVATTSLRVNAPDQAAARAFNGPRFWLEVPGKLRRQYSGTLEVRARGAILEAVVTMPLETAVASVVAAESPPGAGLEALKAQAVAARSFFVAGQAAHTGFDFCDTTHCQFLRSPPAPGSLAAQATQATIGLVLTWHDEAAEQDRILAAMYARSCGGRSRTLREIGLPSNGYPYYVVRCTYCSHHPEVWQRETKALPNTERDRLAFNRIHGWGAIPSLPREPSGSGGASCQQAIPRAILTGGHRPRHRPLPTGSSRHGPPRSNLRPDSRPLLPQHPAYNDPRQRGDALKAPVGRGQLPEQSATSAAIAGRSVKCERQNPKLRSGPCRRFL